MNTRLFRCAWWEHAKHNECKMCGSAKPDAAAAASAKGSGGECDSNGDDDDGEPVIEAFEAQHDEDEDVDYMNLPGVY